MDALRKRFNNELLQILEEEQRKENNPKAVRLTYTYQAEETDYA